MKHSTFTLISGTILLLWSLPSQAGPGDIIIPQSPMTH